MANQITEYCSIASTFVTLETSRLKKSLKLTEKQETNAKIVLSAVAIYSAVRLVNALIFANVGKMVLTGVITYYCKDQCKEVIGKSIELFNGLSQSAKAMVIGLAILAVCAYGSTMATIGLTSYAVTYMMEQPAPQLPNDRVLAANHV